MRRGTTRRTLAGTAPIRPERHPSADVSGGAAKVQQTAGQTVTTVLSVVPPECGGRRSEGGAEPPTARLRVVTRRRPGRWKVTGKYSIGAPVGTDWTTIDGCSQTTTIVRTGRVQIYDRVKQRVVTVSAGHRYVARAS
jgi:hypothetical protein